MRIIYGVAGEGSGHAIRSKPIIEHLKKKNKLIVVCGGKAFSVLSKVSKTMMIKSSRIMHKNNSVQNAKTFFYNLLMVPVYLYYFFKLLMLCSKFKPDIIITDFEPLTSWYALLFRKPLISIDNQHIITNTELNLEGNYADRLASSIIIRSWVPKADNYLVFSFFFPKIKAKYLKNTFLFYPKLRKGIENAKPKTGKFVLVYQTSTTYESLIAALGKVDEKFVVYGLNRAEKYNNIIFKKFSEKDFIDDLAESKAFICNGGFTAITEAFHLRKPVLSIPIKKQYEQIVNARYAKKMGYGTFEEDLSKGKIEKFLKNISKFRKNLKNYGKSGNVSSKLDSLLESFKKSKN